MFKAELVVASKQVGIELTNEQVSAFEKYYNLLIEWNQKINLTAITDPKDVAVKHMVDSLTAFDKNVFSPGCSVVDVGTGAGFPGIPLKIYSPSMSLTLIDSLQKRLNFLQGVISEIGMNGVSLVHSRAEEVGRDLKFREKYDIATARAVARLTVLCEYCLPLVKQGGFFLALKGALWQQELEEAGNAIKILGGQVEYVRPISLSGFADSHAIIAIKKVGETPKSYPRRPGIPEKKPL